LELRSYLYSHLAGFGAIEGGTFFRCLATQLFMVRIKDALHRFDCLDGCLLHRSAVFVCFPARPMPSWAAYAAIATHSADE
jgi:hypothetical protein